MSANLNTAYCDNALIDATAALGRRVIINVDDLGLSEPVNHAVVNLASMRLITATSYMVGGSISDSSIKTLHNFNIDVGLHLDFTGNFKTALPSSLSALIKASYLRRLDPQTVASEIKRQFDDFEDKFNHAPKFIDGHQHVHQFPVIREALINELISRYVDKNQQRVAARITYPLKHDLKAWIIYTLGGHAWRSLCTQAAVPTNQYFGGVYDFQASPTELIKLWEGWLKNCPISPLNNSNNKVPTSSISVLQAPVSVIMCHPAIPDTSWEDEIKQAREIEYQWMISSDFKKLLNTYNIKRTHWSEL